MGDSKEVKEDIKPVEDAPSRSKDLSKTLPEEAFNNFLQGKRHIIVQDYTSAVQSLSTALEMYTQHFGEMALECGELHFLYGKALFRLSQQQAGVLGGALNTANDDEDDDDEEEDGKSSDEEEEESKENEESSEKNETDTDNGENQESETAAEEEEEKEPSESTDSPQPITEEVAKDPAEGDPNVSEVDTSLQKEGNEEQPEAEEDDLELAWNSLETAKSIFLRQGKDNVEAQLKVAEILHLLAEISMESDNNMAAITDLKACLKIKQLHLKPDDRILAETYYQMGLAQMLEKMYLDALENFTTTMKILMLRIENLKNTPVADTPGSFERADIEKEIEELEGVLADIKEKVEDVKELIEDAKKAVEERIASKAVEVEKVGFSTDEASEKKPVSNITHLLKRKKPDQDDEKERESKRNKMSSIQNGDAAVGE